MDRARAAYLITAGLAGNEADEGEDVSQSDPGPHVREVDARHGGDPRIRLFEPSGFERVLAAGAGKFTIYHINIS